MKEGEMLSLRFIVVLISIALSVVAFALGGKGQQSTPEIVELSGEVKSFTLSSSEMVVYMETGGGEEGVKILIEGDTPTLIFEEIGGERERVGTAQELGANYLVSNIQKGITISFKAREGPESGEPAVAEEVVIRK